MDLPFMRTAFTRQGDRGLSEVRNQTWRAEALLAQRWTLGDLPGLARKRAVSSCNSRRNVKSGNYLQRSLTKKRDNLRGLLATKRPHLQYSFTLASLN
jgi:hypothetical protein